jgi:hypothetical protein
MNRREGKKIAVMTAIIMGFMIFAFMPAASATVTSFTVTPDTGIAGAVQSYSAYVITDGVTSINITIPAGFIAVQPVMGGVEIARVDFYNSSTKAYYGHATITANDTNPTTKVDIYWELGGDAITTTQNVDYAAGATNTFESPFGDGSLAILELPEALGGSDGSIEIRINSTAFLLDAVMTSIKQFVRNPLTAGDYTFTADGVDETVSITAPAGYSTIFRDGTWHVDTNGDHIADIIFGYGIPGDLPVVGDINHDGNDDIAIFRDGSWHVDTTGGHIADIIFGYGIPGDLPVVGDINHDGNDDTVIFRDGSWHVDITGDHISDIIFGYGIPGDLPVVGDINHDGNDDTAIFRDGSWHVDTTGDHISDIIFGYGIPGDLPVVGDVG